MTEIMTDLFQQMKFAYSLTFCRILPADDDHVIQLKAQKQLDIEYELMWVHGQE